VFYTGANRKNHRWISSSHRRSRFLTINETPKKKRSNWIRNIKCYMKMLNCLTKILSERYAIGLTLVRPVVASVIFVSLSDNRFIMYTPWPKNSCTILTVMTRIAQLDYIRLSVRQSLPTDSFFHHHWLSDCPISPVVSTGSCLVYRLPNVVLHFSFISLVFSLVFNCISVR